jgi:hypothetical protein
VIPDPPSPERRLEGGCLVVENGSHETLPASEVKALAADFLSGIDVAGRAIALPPPDFPTAAEALAGPPPF